MLFRRTLLGLTFVWIAAGYASAQPRIPLDYTTFTLDNGLQVFLVEDHSAPVVTVNVWYNVGGANDPEGRSGFAHLFEHLMFQGTANLGKDELLRIVDDAGGTFNAYTAVDRTAYHETLPAHQLPLGLWLEADRMASLAVTQTNLDNQRAVVIQEYQQNYTNAPYGMALLDFYTLTYSYEPYRRSPIGAVQDVNAATVDEIRAFHQTYYVPNNATLVVVGDFDPATARELVELYYGQIPRGDDPPALPGWQPAASTGAEIFVIEDSLVRIPATLIGFEIPTPGHPDMPALEVLAAILGTGDSSRLARDYIDTGIALAADAFVEMSRGPGLFGVILLPASISRDELEQRFADDLARIVAEGVSQEEIDKAVALIRSQRIATMETTFGIAEVVQTGLHHFGDPVAFVNQLDLIAAVTPDDIRRVAAEYLGPEDRHVFRVNSGPPQPFVEPVPFVGATGTPADDEFTVDFALPFAEAPAPLPVTTLDLPPITETTLPNGLTVVVVETPELPVLSLDLVYRGGRSILDGPPAIAGIVSQLVTRGTSTMSAQEIAVALEARGGITGGYAEDDFIGFGIFALIEDRALAFELLSQMAFDPTFPQEELDVQLGQLAGDLQAALGDPANQAARAFNPAIYGQHPYGAVTTLDDLGAISRDAIVSYYRTVARPDNALLIVAGRITADEALVLAEQYFADWTADAEAALPPVPAAAEQTGVPILLVDVPGAQQAELIIGNVAVDGTNPARYSLSVANAVLGQGLSSRLNRIIREELGYSYGVRSRLSFPAGRGAFAVSASVQVSTVAAAIAEIIAQVDRIRGELIPETELNPVRDGMIGRFALNLETYQDYVIIISSYWVRGLSLSEIGAYPSLIAAVTPQTALEAAGALLPENLIIVVAGDAAVLAPLLEPLGPVTVLEAR